MNAKVGDISCSYVDLYLLRDGGGRKNNFSVPWTIRSHTDLYSKKLGMAYGHFYTALNRIRDIFYKSICSKNWLQSVKAGTSNRLYWIAKQNSVIVSKICSAITIILFDGMSLSNNK